MKTELLVRIKEAEDQARQGIHKAEEEAKAIVADARRQADSIVADGREQAEFQFQERLEATRKKATQEGRKAVAQGEEQAAALRQRFEGALAPAQKRVLALFEERI